MSAAAVPFVVVMAYVTAAVVLAWAYFRCAEIERPPIGVFNGRDMASMLTMVMATPFLYLALPRYLVAAFMATVVTSILWFLFRPLLRTRLRTWPVVLSLVAADVALSLAFEVSNRFLVLNNAVLVLVAVAFANVLAQSGLKARHLAIFASTIAVYDYVAVVRLDLMTELFEKIGRLPFGPLVVWRAGEAGLGIGLGDVILMALAPIVLRKAYGLAAGVVAAVSSLATAALVLVLVASGAIAGGLPVLVVFGPVVVVQCLAWRALGRRERTTRRYLEEEPRAFVLSANDLALGRR